MAIRYGQGMPTVIVIADATNKLLSIWPPHPSRAVELRNKTSRHNSQLVILPTDAAAMETADRSIWMLTGFYCCHLGPLFR